MNSCPDTHTKIEQHFVYALKNEALVGLNYRIVPTGNECETGSYFDDGQCCTPSYARKCIACSDSYDPNFTPHDLQDWESKGCKVDDKSCGCTSHGNGKLAPGCAQGNMFHSKQAKLNTLQYCGS